MLTSKKGFKLVEVLITLAIIIVIVAMIFPVHRQSTCLCNLHQIQVALAMYNTDSSHQLHSANEGWGAKWWPKVLWPYLEDAQVYICPSDPEPGHLKYGGPVRRCSYGFNDNCWAIAAPTFERSTMPLPPDYPSEMMMLGESDTLSFRSVSTIKFNHQGGANFVFMDGRAKRLVKGTAPIRVTPSSFSDDPAVWHFWYGTDPRQ